MLKKFLIGTFAVVLLGSALVASAAYDFGTTTLKVGSKGEAVKAVQTVVGATPADGVFGKMTKAKVMAWQASNGLKADGVFGNASKAKANGGAVTSGTCPAGQFDPMTGKACGETTTYPAGCTSTVGYSTTTGTKCDGTTTPGTTTPGTTDGSITASTSSYVSSGITLKKGDTKDVAAVRLQATAGPVKVSRVDVTFNVRPWLYFSTVALHDNTGKVLATKTLTGISDTTELTVGSLYMVRFDGIDYTVTPGTNPDLAVSASVLPATDKISGTQLVTTTFSAMRTISEIGYVDSPTVSQSNTVTLSSNSSTAAIYSRISPSAPLAGQQVINATNTTTDVTLGAFSLKSTNNSSTLNTFVVNMSGTATDTTAFSNFRLYVGGSSVAGGVLSGDNGTVTFNNLTVPLPLDTWTDLIVKADIASSTVVSDGVTVAVTLTDDSSHVTVTDVNYGTPTYDAGVRSGNTLTLTQNSVAVSGISAVLGSAIVQSNVTTGYNATYAFTLTNNSNNDLYVSSTPGTFVGTTTAGSTGTVTGTGLTSVTLSPATVSGDGSGYYAIPAGTARTFTFAAVLRGSTAGTTVFKATQINYSTSNTLSPLSNVATGLSTLSLTASF